MADEDEKSAPPTISISTHMEPANMEPASAEPEKDEPETKGFEYLLGLGLPLLILFAIYGSGLLSAGMWDFNRRVEVVLYSDDDGVFQFSAEPETSHGQKESVSIIFLDTAWTGGSMAYRPEINIGPTPYYQTIYNDHCDTEPGNTVCMYFLKDTGGELEFTKIGEYDQYNHTAEFVLEDETDESIGVRIDYHDRGAEQHFNDVEQPRNEKLVFTLVPLAYVCAFAFAAATGRSSLFSGLTTSIVVIVALGALWILAVIGAIFSLAGGGY